MQRYQLTRRNLPASYEYYPRLPRLGAICNCSSPSFPRIIVSEPSPHPLFACLCYIYSSFHLRSSPPLPPRLINLSFSPADPIPSRYLPLSLYYPLLFPAFVICSCLSGSLHNNRGREGESERELGVIRSTMASVIN